MTAARRALTRCTPLLRAATRRPAPVLSALRAPPRTIPARRTAAFSTMSPLQSSAPPAAAPQQYDAEVADIAAYVHNYRIDSDLAVRSLPYNMLLLILTKA
jgi:2-methylcitrate dehydratase